MTNKPFTSDLPIFIGNILDHFNSAIYIFLAPILAPIFFPNHEPILQNILTYSILITSVFTRPLGAIIFGAIANYYGPTLSLSYSLIGVAVSTFLLGALPGYDTIGYLAPLSLILIKLLHGIFSSGENTIASLYVIENKTSTNELKASYYYAITTMFGIIVAAFSSSIIINIKPYAWRLCFWIGGIIGILGSYLRYFNFKTSPTIPIATTTTNIINFNLIAFNWSYLLRHKVYIVYIATIVGFTNLTYALAFTLPNILLSLISKPATLSTMTSINNYLLIFDLLLIVITGKIILKFQINYTKIMLFSSSILAITVLPLFNLLPSASLNQIILIKAWIIFWAVIFVCPLNLWCNQFLSTLPNSFNGKYFLMGIGNNIGNIIIGKTCTPICLYLWYKTNSILAPALYITILMLPTVMILLSMEHIRNNFRIWALAVRNSRIFTFKN